MKLFTEAGSTANIGVVLYRTAIHGEKSTEAFKLLFYIFVGILLGEQLAKLCGMEIPWLLFIAIEVLIVVFLGGLIFRQLFRKQRIMMSFTPESKAGSFLLNPNQILWASPMGDVPVFDHRGYKVRQQVMGDGTHYICTGKTGNAMRYEMQRIMPEEKIWKCRKLIFEFGPQLEQYPEAIQILEQKGGNHCEKAVC